ncbi:hypothetical protein Pelo_1892 [Pelomyxa schiedti]|nr:hypothetical protein Pelo_1892 [Pelomyxa schiedti]
MELSPDENGVEDEEAPRTGDGCSETPVDDVTIAADATAGAIVGVEGGVADGDETDDGAEFGIGIWLLAELDDVVDPGAAVANDIKWDDDTEAVSWLPDPDPLPPETERQEEDDDGTHGSLLLTLAILRGRLRNESTEAWRPVSGRGTGLKKTA